MEDEETGAGGGGEASPPQHAAESGNLARDMAVPQTSSRNVTRTVNGSHHFVIQGYSLTKGMGVGKHIASETFTVGGHKWAIYFYPDGKNPEGNPGHVSAFIALVSDGTEVRALFGLTLLDQSGKGEHKVHSHFHRSPESGPYTLCHRGSMWGFKRFFPRNELELSRFLKDDCLKINCTVGVVVSTTTGYSRPYSIEVPESNIGYHCGTLLDTKEGVDVIFSVAGEKFHAHQLVLAARSPFFRAEFFDHEMGEEKNGTDTMDEIKEMVIDDMDPVVFKAVLQFIYTDNLVNDDAVSSSDCSIFDSLPGTKLMAAADKYELPRLRSLCESYLCNHISINSVATTLALADRHHATELKSVCLKFAAQNLSAVIRTEGYNYLKDNISLQSEILRTVAGFEEPSGSHMKSQSVWAQLSNGGDTSGRRVRPRV